MTTAGDAFTAKRVPRTPDRPAHKPRAALMTNYALNRHLEVSASGSNQAGRK